MGKQDDARRVFVQPVQRGEVFGIQVLQFGTQPQAGEQGFAQKAAAGDDGQEVRFVGHNQVFVDVQDVFLKRHGFFFGGDGFAVVVNRAAGAECGIGGQRRAGFGEDVAVGKPVRPDFAAAVGEAAAEEVEQQSAVQFFVARQVEVARFDAVDQRQRGGFFHGRHCNRISDDLFCCYNPRRF